MIPIKRYTATFSQLTPDNADNDKETWVDVSGLEGIGVDIQPASANPSEIATGVFEKTHIMFVDTVASGIQEGWRVTVSGLYDGKLNRTLSITGVEDWAKGPLPHYQLTLGELDD